MKQKLIITAIVALAIGFVGLAGGFTKTVAVQKGTHTVCRNVDGVRVVNPDDLLNLEMEYARTPFVTLPPPGSAKVGGTAPIAEERKQDGWCGEWMRQKYGYTLNDEPYEQPCPYSEAMGYPKEVAMRTCEYEKEFDQRRTAMFAIGGAIIGLLPLARKGR